jgi:hypothetical protein
VIGLGRIRRSSCYAPGYSWKSSQYGLTVDTVVAYELVLPNGTVTEVKASNPDLFFALKVSSDGLLPCTVIHMTDLYQFRADSTIS